MFYQAAAHNAQPLTFWATNPADADRYIDWLNRKRDINVYAAHELGEAGHEDECAFSCDEPYWDDFMVEDTE